MTPEEVAARARAGGVTFAFDTNALFGEKPLIAICNAVARYNERLIARGLAPLRLLVCAVAHAEKVFDLKQQFKGTFDIDVIVCGLQRKGLFIQPFNVDHALETAVRLGERYATTADWRAAKRERCLKCLALPPKTPTPGSGQHCGATIDWLIGGHARSEGALLVTDDTGPEFMGLTEHLKLTTLKIAIEQLLAEPS